MKKSTIGLIVCLVIAVTVSIAAIIYEKRVKESREADLAAEKRNAIREKCNYGGDEMHEPPDPIPLAPSTNTLAR